jgi:hypothetical protein
VQRGVRPVDLASFSRSDGNAVAVRCEPGVEVLKLGIQRACEIEVARAEVLGLEVALELAPTTAITLASLIRISLPSWFRARPSP